MFAVLPELALVVADDTKRRTIILQTTKVQKETKGANLPSAIPSESQQSPHAYTHVPFIVVLHLTRQTKRSSGKTNATESAPWTFGAGLRERKRATHGATPARARGRLKKSAIAITRKPNLYFPFIGHENYKPIKPVDAGGLPFSKPELARLLIIVVPSSHDP